MFRKNAIPNFFASDVQISFYNSIRRHLEEINGKRKRKDETISMSQRILVDGKFIQFHSIESSNFRIHQVLFPHKSTAFIFIDRTYEEHENA